MSVVHPAVAKNYENMGYYPTDQQTLDCIIQCVDPTEEPITLFDPCCGEALAVDYLHKKCCSNARMVGIELDTQRFSEAKKRLAHGIQADAIVQVKHSRNCVSFLFLNPPYGQSTIHGRLEYAFINRYIHTLRPGGVMALVIPTYIVNKKIATYLCHHFDQLHYGCSPEQKYRQMIIMGRKIKRTAAKNVAENANKLVLAADTEIKFVPGAVNYSLLPESECFELYSSKMTADSVAEVIDTHFKATLWNGFKRDYVHAKRKNRHPLMPLSDWHTAQTILAGMVSGLVESNQRRMLIKGTVSKRLSKAKIEGDKSVQVEKFEPVIIGLDLTRDSQHFGQLFEIK